MNRFLNSSYCRSLSSVVTNIFISLSLFAIGRIIFFLVNLSMFSHLGWSDLPLLLEGCLVFDLSAVAYINILYVLLMFLPLHFKEYGLYQRFTKIVFVSLNSVALFVNIGDSLYYPFSKRRTTSAVFREFGNDDNVGKVIFDEVINNWYLVAIFIGLVWLMWRLYRSPKGSASAAFQCGRLWLYYPLQLIYLALSVALSVAAMRGGIGADVRPITISNASQYVSRPADAALVLNTPFAAIRTWGKRSFEDPHYYSSSEELEEIFTPIKGGAEAREGEPLNVVVIIMESFGREYIGALNRDKGEDYPSYTPFLDSLITESLSFERSFSNGLKSIDGMPSILSGIPMFVEPFFLTTSSLNKVSGIAGELKSEGYHTSFFHGAARGSMGFMAFAKATGFEEYYGREDFGNDEFFDGRWSIWDEEFFEYFGQKLSTFEEPFASAIFSASSHHPFKVPARYEGVFPEGSVPLHKCIGYSDNALRLFFESIEREEWFPRTLFVITADHTSLTAYPERQTTASVFNVPIILYHPASDLKGYLPTIAQQIDIMPTVLGYLGYPNAHLSFGRDLLGTPHDEGYAVNYYNGVYQLFEGEMLLQFDGTQSIALYNYVTDPLLSENLLSTPQAKESAPQMESTLKAIIQQYMARMASDRLVP